MAVSSKDRDIVRSLAARVAEIAGLPVQKEKAELWRRLNGLQPTRPLVWIDEIPWHEVGEAVEPQASDERVRPIEAWMRRLLYTWEHFPADMVVEAVHHAPCFFEDTGYGLTIQAARTEMEYGAARYESVIESEADVEKIRPPRIRPDWRATEEEHEFRRDLFGDTLEVSKRGVVHEWFAPWDLLMQWYGIEKLFTDVIDRPQLVHKAIRRLMCAMLARLNQLEEHRLLSISNGNHRVGSGGLGITDELPQPDFNPEHVRPLDQWGNSTGQIFAGASPAMHEEFCLQYEMRYLERFGLNCYGCCEPLHKKLAIVKRIPRLRRISISPWADVAESAEQIGADYILSLKPNPAVLAAERWDADLARRELRDSLEKARGCRVEVIMKDIHTFKREPERLSAWEKIAMEEVGRLG